MEQFFVLRWHAGLTLFEQDNLTFEERSWLVKRINKQMQDEKDSAESNSSRK